MKEGKLTWGYKNIIVLHNMAVERGDRLTWGIQKYSSYVAVERGER